MYCTMVPLGSTAPASNVGRELSPRGSRKWGIGICAFLPLPAQLIPRTTRRITSIARSGDKALMVHTRVTGATLHSPIRLREHTKVIISPAGAGPGVDPCSLRARIEESTRFV